jgi:branched-chain amino acid transport system permease protein
VAGAWDLIIGYSRVFSFGQLAFFLIGGYISAMMAILVGISPWVSMLIGGIAAGIVGVLIGLPCLRLAGIYVAMVTFALHLVLPTIIQWGADFTYTGGTTGLMGIPTLKLAGYAFPRNELTAWYYLALVLFFVFFLIIYKIINSSLGMAFIALRDAELFAKCLGVDDYKYKIVVFGISSFIAGVMGAFYGHYIGMFAKRIKS